MYINNMNPQLPFWVLWNDDRIQTLRYRRSFSKIQPVMRPRFTDRWWQRSRYTGYSITTDGVYVGDDSPMMGQWDLWSRRITKAGAKTRLLIQGRTLDSNNNVVPNCPVKAFHTVDDSFVQQVTSDPVGAYVLPTPYTDAHYIVAVLTGLTDSIGVTDNDRTGS